MKSEVVKKKRSTQGDGQNEHVLLIKLNYITF